MTVLADNVTTTEIGLDLPEDLDFEEWLTLGEKLCRMDRAVQWWVGDWWTFGGHAYGERARLAAQGLFGRSFQTLMDCGSVARKFETSRRHEVLSFKHHREVAALPPPEADELLDTAEAEGWSTRELRAEVSRRRNAPGEQPHSTGNAPDLQGLVDAGQRFGTIYADPPWLYSNQGTRAATSKHYKGMTVDQLCALPVRDLALPDAHLHLWTTNGFLFECPRVFEAWGFTFKSSFVWLKTDIGIGNYWRNSHEFLLTAVRGNAKRFRDHSLKSWITCKRGKHSVKPDEAREYVERASPGPYFEMFARRQVPGWTVWGDQVAADIEAAA